MYRRSIFLAGAVHRIDAPEASSYFTGGAAAMEDGGCRGGQGMMSWPWKALGVRGREVGKQPKVGSEGKVFGETQEAVRRRRLR